LGYSDLKIVNFGVKLSGALAFLVQSLIRYVNRVSPIFLLTTTSIVNMLRIPLGPQSSNIRRGPELTPYARGKIVGAAQSGKTPTQIADTSKLSRSTIR
jgi:hypothetical protein